ncbi:MAG TPA: hypothetical protein VFU49_15610 [Ktedonobacteraceae bacterium]|nr:hypothetical protein [Ktedonobacteraceae bacterium]
MKRLGSKPRCELTRRTDLIQSRPIYRLDPEQPTSLEATKPPNDAPQISYRPALARPIYRLDAAPDRANGGKNAAIKPAINDCGKNRVFIGKQAALRANEAKGQDAQ